MLRCSSWCRWLAVVALASSSLLVGRGASAFCRTTTKLQPADYDSTVTGCWDKDPKHGIPLFWRNSCVGYSIERASSKKIGFDDAANLLSQAFTRWTGATCRTVEDAGTSRVGIDVRYLGPANCTNIGYVSRAPNQNVIVFRDEGWERTLADGGADPRYPPTVLGLTTVVFAPSSGEILGADMELNTEHMTPIALTDPVAGDAYDFLSIVTHEAGHFLGMAHSDHENTTMYARYLTSWTYQRVLSPDDVEGICEVYKPNGDRAVFTGKVTAAPQCDPTPRGGYTTDCVEASRCSSAPGTTSSAVSAVLLGVALGGWGLRRRGRRDSPARRPGPRA